MTSEILNITDSPQFDESVTSYEIHVHEPFSLNFAYGNEISIIIQHQDIYSLPSESYLYIEGEFQFQKVDAAKDAYVEVSNNYCASLFDNMSYSINSEIIENVRKPGLISLIRTLLTRSKSESLLLENAGYDENLKLKKVTSSGEKFNVVLPLSMIFGFCADFTKILPYSKQELKLFRSQNDNNIFVETNAKNSKVEIKKMLWCVPYINVENKEKIKLLKLFERDTKLDIAFRTWDINEHPNVQSSKECIWNIKTTSSIERPRFIIVFFSSARKNNLTKDFGHFDHCNLTNITLYLNSQSYPYESMTIDFDNKKIAMIYNNYLQFIKLYDGKTSESMVSLDIFKNKFPLFVIPCNNQNEMLKSGTIDVKLKLEFSKNVAENTTIYAIIISDRIIEYKIASKSIYHKV